MEQAGSKDDHGGARRDAEDPHARGTLVVCFGNAFRGDDGFGLAVAERLGDSLAPHADLAVRGGDALGLLDAWRGYQRVILVDALASDAPVGTLFHYDLSRQALPFELGGTSTHALGPAGAVEMARALGALPPRVEILAAAARSFSPGAALSAELEAQLGPAAARIQELVGAFEPLSRRTTDA